MYNFTLKSSMSVFICLFNLRFDWNSIMWVYFSPKLVLAVVSLNDFIFTLSFLYISQRYFVFKPFCIPFHWNACHSRVISASVFPELLLPLGLFIILNNIILLTSRSSLDVDSKASSKKTFNSFLVISDSIFHTTLLCIGSSQRRSEEGNGSLEKEQDEYTEMWHSWLGSALQNKI